MSAEKYSNRVIIRTSKYISGTVSGVFRSSSAPTLRHSIENKEKKKPPHTTIVMDGRATLEELKSRVKSFSEARDWDQFHSPKELAIGVATEAVELLDHFRFKNDEQMKQLLENPKSREEISDELADSFYFILRFAQMYGIDLSESLDHKLKKNEVKYPVEKTRGSNRKYSEY